MPKHALVVEHSPVWEKTTYKVPITDDAPTDADELRDWVMAKVLAGEAELEHAPEVKSSIDGMDSDYAAPTYEDEPEPAIRVHEVSDEELAEASPEYRAHLEALAAKSTVVPAGHEPAEDANVYAIGAVFIVTSSNARDAWNFFESSEHSNGAHAASNPHAVTREQAMDPDWTIDLTYGATKLTPIPADEEEER